MINKIYFTPILILFSLTLIFQGCQKNKPETNQLITASQDQLLCSFNFNEYNNRLYDFWLQEKMTPSPEEVKALFLEEIQHNKSWSAVTEEDKEKVISLIYNYYQFLAEKLTSIASTPGEKLQLLTSLELGDYNEEKNELQSLWDQEKQTFEFEISKLHLPLSSLCAQSKVEAARLKEQNLQTPIEISATSQNRITEGLRRVFATAYQSCDTLNVKPLSSKTPNLQGIKIIQDPNNTSRGKKRVYQDIQKIFNTNPYYALKSPLKQGCFDNRNQPLIYDFGGKPKTTTSINSSLDLFTNSGSGTEVLGIDCSGLVFSALARGGLLFNANEPLKAVLVHGTSAQMFKNPNLKRWTCFDSLANLKNATLLPGDIIASNGHVVMVDQIGRDPLGLQRAKNISDCNETMLTADGFDFTIIQSSPWKNGMGIQKSVAKDYLKGETTFRNGLVQFAQYFCQEKFKTKNKNQKFANTLAMPDITKLNVIRHKGTPECLASKPIALNYEACVDSCSFE